jgi:integrase
MKTKRPDGRRSKACSANKGNLERLMREPGRYPVSDAPGMFFKVKAPGKAFWTFRYRFEGKESELSLGAYPETDIKTALGAHAAVRKTLVTDKIDPLAGRRKTPIATPAAGAPTKPTFAEMAEAYIADKGREWRSERHRGQWRQTIADYCAPIALMPVDQVDRAAALGILKPLWKCAPQTASRLRGRIEMVLDYAYVNLGIEDKVLNPARWKGKLDKIFSKPPRAKNFRALPWVEVPAFMADLKARSGNVACGLGFAVLTAARTGEVMGMRWGEVKLDNVERVGDGLVPTPIPLWTVPEERMKAGRQHRVPLSAAAVETLKEQRSALGLEPGAEPDRGAYVFPGQSSEKPLSSMAFIMLLRAMRVDGVTHGFRSAFKDWGTDATSFARETVEAALAHTVGDKAEQSYRRGDALFKRSKLMDAWAEHCAAAATGAQVIPISAARP